MCVSMNTYYVNTDVWQPILNKYASDIFQDCLIYNRLKSTSFRFLEFITNLGFCTRFYTKVHANNTQDNFFFHLNCYASNINYETNTLPHCHKCEAHLSNSNIARGPHVYYNSSWSTNNIPVLYNVLYSLVPIMTKPVNKNWMFSSVLWQT